MIDNWICPYCLITMIVAENQPNSRSVEHLIPNAVLTVKRKNDQGDFYACRTCNGNKSKVDELIGTVAKAQSDDPSMAAKAMVKTITKHNAITQRFSKMLNSVEHHNNGVHMDIPISGSELIEYLIFLGKGLHFKKYGKPFSSRRHVMLLGFNSKHIHAPFKEQYVAAHGSDPIRDLELNQRTEIIAPGEAIIWSKNDSFLVVLHDYISISIKFKPRNKKNISRAQQKIDELKSAFKW